MRLLYASLTLLAGSHVIAQSTNPPCIATCTRNNAISSQCDGDETGAALDRCTCASYLSNADSPLITCVKACSTADQSAFVRFVPELCRGQLFPGVTAAPSTTSATTTGAPPAATTTTTGATGQQTPGAAAGLTIPGLVAAAGGVLAALAL